MLSTPVADDHKLTSHDDDLAGLLMQRGVEDQLRYDHGRAQWHFWNKFRWERDATGRAYAILRDHAMELIENFPGDVRKMVLPLLNHSKKEAVLKALSSHNPIAMRGSEWDTQPELLGVQNGIVDLTRSELIDGVHPELLVTKAARVKYDPSATAPKFIGFLRQIMDGDMEMADYLLCVLGYSLFGWQREQKFWLWVGAGTNGKGTLAKVITHVLGEYASSPSSELYMKSKFGSQSASAPRAELVRLQGQRFTWMSEPQGHEFNDELVKAHTGDDPITARDLYARANQAVEFRPSHTMVFLTNDPPRIEDVGPSMRRRARVINFPVDFSGAKMNPDLEQELKAESAGILNLLVAAAQHYYQNGLKEPEKVTKWSAEYIEQNDPLGQWLSDRCSVEVGAKTPNMLLYESYVDWCREGGLEFKSISGFGMDMTKRFRKQKTMTGIVYHGVRLKGAMSLAEEDDDDDA